MPDDPSKARVWEIAYASAFVAGFYQAYAKNHFSFDQALKGQRSAATLIADAAVAELELHLEEDK